MGNLVFQKDDAGVIEVGTEVEKEDGDEESSMEDAAVREDQIKKVSPKSCSAYSLEGLSTTR